MMQVVEPNRWQRVGLLVMDGEASLLCESQTTAGVERCLVDMTPEAARQLARALRAWARGR